MSEEYTLPRVMQFLQLEWQRNERDRIQWDIERAEMKSRITKLQGDSAAATREAQSLRRTVDMLQHKAPADGAAALPAQSDEAEVHNDLGKLTGARQYLDECVKEVRSLLEQSGVSQQYEDHEQSDESAYGAQFGARSRLVQTLANFSGDPVAICPLVESVFAVGTDDGHVLVWGLDTGTTVVDTVSQVVTLLLNSVDMQLYVVCQDSIQLYSVGLPDGHLTRIESVECPQTVAAAWSQELGQLAVCFADGTIKLYSGGSLTVESTMRLFRESVGVVQTACTYVSEGTKLLVGNNDGGLLLVDPASSQVVKRVHSPPAHTVLATVVPAVDAIVKVSDQVVITGHRNGDLRVFDLSRGLREELAGAHTRGVTSLAISPSGSTLVSTSANGRVSLWTVNLGNIAWLGRLLTHDSLECSGAVSSAWTHNNLVAIGGGDGILRLYSLV